MDCGISSSFPTKSCCSSFNSLIQNRTNNKSRFPSLLIADFPHNHLLSCPHLSSSSRSQSPQTIYCSSSPGSVAGIHKFARVHEASRKKYSPLHSLWRTYSKPVGLEEQSLSGSSEFHDDEPGSTDPAEERLSQTLSSDELKSLLADSQRSQLVKKLSEANQHNRFLKRQLQGREDALVNFKSELAVLEQEVKALVSLADEIAKAGIPEGSRKINGKYIHSHLVARLEALQHKLEDQIKDVAAAQPKEVPVFWIGMAESVQVMGSFDGWSQGEHLSPEYTGSYTKFSTMLMLRPGRYEIKFLVDGEWRISPEFPTVGEGLMRNNLLVVE